MINQNVLIELLEYDADTGKLFWKKRDKKWFKNERIANAWNTQHSLKECFCIKSHEYLAGTIFKKRYLTHRIIWLLIYGEYPDQIDHINGIKTDNRLINLRNVTKSVNMTNTKISSVNTTGTVGIYWSKSSKKWFSRIQKNKKVIHLGFFDDKEEAISVRKAAEIKYGFHKNHGRKQ